MLTSKYDDELYALIYALRKKKSNSSLKCVKILLQGWISD